MWFVEAMVAERAWIVTPLLALSRKEQRLDKIVHFRLSQPETLPTLAGALADALHFFRHFQEDLEVVKGDRR